MAVVSASARTARAIALCALLLLTTAPAAAAARTEGVEEAPEVVEARERAAVAEARLAARTVELDRAAAAYEMAAAHRVRLEAELEGAAEVVAGAEERVERARSTLTTQVRDLYRRPREPLAVVEALVGSQDVASALHSAALLERAAVRAAGGVERAREDGARTIDGVRHHRIVASGTTATAALRAADRDVLVAAVGSAREAHERARSELEATRAATAARLEAERAAAERLAAEQARAAAALAANFGAGAVTGVGAAGAPLPPVAGKVCPIGAPNGFSDSWGAPRPGGRRHAGVDLFAAHDTPLYAVTDAIADVGANVLGGLTVHLTDANGDVYYYAHLSATAVSDGQRVMAGQVVGANGNSGNARSTPPHLHWEYRPAGGPSVNPYPLAVALCRPG